MKKSHDTSLKERIDRAIELVAELNELLPDLVQLDLITRKHSIGKLRDGETDAMRAVLDACDADPKRFETAPSREALHKRDELARLHKMLRSFSLRLSDSILALGAEAREVTNAAYHIARVNSDADPKLKTLLAPAFAFYARGGRPKSKSPKNPGK
jgi:hypothetical protein